MEGGPGPLLVEEGGAGVQPGGGAQQVHETAGSLKTSE